MSESERAGARLNRLLALLAYLARVGEASIAELAERFEVPAATLVAELELAACCGLPPYTPDQLLELVVDDEGVSAHGLEALSRPPRLSPEEGLAVAAAARALLAVPGADAGPLRSALDKLEAVLGEDRVLVDVDLPLHMGKLRAAAERHELVEIDYLGAFRGGETTRIVEPHEVSLREGHAYLDAWCHLAGHWRRFSLERIQAVRPLGEAFVRRELPEAMSRPGAFSGGQAARRTKISVPIEQAGALVAHADGPIEERDGRAIVPLAVADERFLGLVLLRLGGDAEVLEPEELRDARRDAARRALRRYRRQAGEAR